MADKGFDIHNDLKKLDLKLNIPPYLKEKVGFGEDDAIKTQTVARHRINVERAICKIRRFRIFHSIIPVTMFGSINQIWSVACLLSNFQNPVLARLKPTLKVHVSVRISVNNLHMCLACFRDGSLFFSLCLAVGVCKNVA